MPGAPLFRRTATHARHKTSLRLILSYSAWNLRPGSALAARYSACCKARTGSPATGDPFAAGLALTALTGPLLTTLRTDEAAALPSPQVVLSCGSTGTTAASDAHPASHPLPGVTGYRTPRSGSTIRRLPGRGGPPQFPPPPSIRSAPPTPGSSSRLRFQALHRFHGLHPGYGGSALPCPALTGGNGYDAAGFASCYGPHRRSPFTGLLTLGSDPARFQTEPPACYRASWQLPGPDFHRQATTSLRTRRSAVAFTSRSHLRSAGRTKKMLSEAAH